MVIRRMITQEWMVKISFILCVIAVALLAVNVALMPRYVSTRGIESYEWLRREADFFKGITNIMRMQEEEIRYRTIKVVGIGSASSKPELVRIRISVITRAESASEAQRTNSERMNKVIENLMNAGISREQIRTVRYSLSPIYEYKEGAKIFVGYECVNTIEIESEEIERAGEFIDLAVAGGANRIESITFTLKSGTIEKLEEEALAKAVEDAKNKAEVIAKAAGVKIRGPISITVGYGTYRITDIRFLEETKTTTPIIAPEELSITAIVTIVYEIEL